MNISESEEHELSKAEDSGALEYAVACPIFVTLAGLLKHLSSGFKSIWMCTLDAVTLKMMPLFPSCLSPA